jgi:hypothetical protein
MIEPTDEALRDWLLGRLPSAEAEALEQRVLADDAFGARLADAETDLLDDLAAGRLADGERAAALARFTATPRARWRLRIARALARFAKPEAARVARHAHRTTEVRHAGRRRGWLVGAFGAAAAIAVVVVGLNLRAPAPGTQVATITLLADRQRGPEGESIAVPKNATSVRLQLEVDDAAQTARYALEIEEAGHVVYGADDLAPRTAGAYRFVEAEVPKRVLANGERVVRVRAGAAYARSWTLRIRDE